MKREQGNTGVVIAAVIAAVVGGCVSKKELNQAHHSLYDADFAIVYSAAVESVRRLYPTYDDNPTTGVIKTAWHQIKYTDLGADDPKTSQVNDRAAGNNSTTVGGTGTAIGGTGPSASAQRLRFIRFDVVVTGGRPWRVRIKGQASQMEPGNALPTAMRGEAAPHWLAGRTDELTIAIHRRLKQYAVLEPEAVETKVVVEDVVIKGTVPAPANEIAVAVVRALHKRDYAALRKTLSDDIVWSPRAAPGPDLAMATWQADPSVLTRLADAIATGCGEVGAEVACPAIADSAHPQVRFGERAGVWKLVRFVAAN